MELGGHAPVVVFDDIDVDRIAELSAAAKFRNAGQVCTSPTRFYVHEKVQDRFAERFADFAKRLPVGDGLDAASRMGPTANPRRIDAMNDFVSDARRHGAQVLAGGERIGNAGYFWRPTVLKNVSNDARIMSVEPFGPVAIVNSFREFDEVVEQANRLPYGLAAYAFTESERRATHISEALESGLVAVNSFSVSWSETPFGGVKESGYGSEGGVEGLQSHLVTKFISHTVGPR
jgi:succinate-semialdehyde dehydrogenase/glutarate-semialdehyde dehydrogenase